MSSTFDPDKIKDPDIPRDTPAQLEARLRVILKASDNTRLGAPQSVIAAHPTEAGEAASLFEIASMKLDDFRKKFGARFHTEADAIEAHGTIKDVVGRIESMANVGGCWRADRGLAQSIKTTSARWSLERLVSEKKDNFSRIASLSGKMFERQFAENCGADPEIAGYLHRNAVQINAQAQHLLANARSILSPYWQATAFGNTKAVSKHLMSSGNSGYEELFGPFARIGYDSSTSIFCPAAYLASLLDVVCGFVKGGREELARRRPDLFKIKLSPDNTSQLQPYVQIVNRLLENLISNGTTKDIYRDLATSSASFATPFNLPNFQALLYLEKMGYSAANILHATKRKKPAEMTLEDIGEALAFLGLSWEQCRIVAPKDCTKDIDLAAGELSKFIKGTDLPAAKFLEATGFTLAELMNLLTQDLAPTEAKEAGNFFINGTEKSGTPPPPLTLATGKEKDTVIANATPYRVGRLLRFARLARWTKTRFDALEWLIGQSDSKDIDEAALIALANVKRMAGTFGVCVDEALCFVAPMKYVGRGNGVESSTFFDRIFNPKVLLQENPAYRPAPPLSLDPILEISSQSPFVRRIPAALGITEIELCAIGEVVQEMIGESPALPEEFLSNLDSLIQLTTILEALLKGSPKFEKISSAVGKFTTFLTELKTKGTALNKLAAAQMRALRRQFRMAVMKLANPEKRQTGNPLRTAVMSPRTFAKRITDLLQDHQNNLRGKNSLSDGHVQEFIEKCLGGIGAMADVVCGKPIDLSYENLTRLFRLAREAQLNGCGVSEYCQLLAALEPDRRVLAAEKPVDSFRRFYKIADYKGWLGRSGISVPELRYIVEDFGSAFQVFASGDAFNAWREALVASSESVRLNSESLVAAGLTRAEAAALFDKLKTKVITPTGIFLGREINGEMIDEKGNVRFSEVIKYFPFGPTGSMQPGRAAGNTPEKKISDEVADLMTSLGNSNLVKVVENHPDQYRLFKKISFEQNEIERPAEQDSAAMSLYCILLQTQEKAEKLCEILQKLLDRQQEIVYEGFSRLFGETSAMGKVLFAFASAGDDAQGWLVAFLDDAKPKTGEANLLIDRFARIHLLKKKLGLEEEELNALRAMPKQFGIYPEDAPDQGWDVGKFAYEHISAVFAFKEFASACRDRGKKLPCFLGNDAKLDKRQILIDATGWDEGHLDMLMPLFQTGSKVREVDELGVVELIQMKTLIELIRRSSFNVDVLAGVKEAYEGDGKNKSNEAIWEQYTTLARQLFTVISAQAKNRLDQMDEQLQGVIEAKKRAILTGEAIRACQKFEKPPHDTNDLFKYLLMDIEMGPTENSTLIVEAINSVQMFLQRARMGLEAAVEITEIPEAWWSWILAYRVWEAKRRIFLYPENYLDPGMRKSSTPAFSRLIGDLQQGPVSVELVEKAFTNYLDEFDVVSNLVHVGACRARRRNGNRDLLTSYFVARTHTTPFKYYLRKWDQRADSDVSVWTAWEPIDISVNAEWVSPVYAFDRLFLFWVEHEKITNPSAKSDNTKTEQSQQWRSQANTEALIKIKYTFQKIDGTWTATQDAKSSPMDKVRDDSNLSRMTWQKPFVQYGEAIISIQKGDLRTIGEFRGFTKSKDGSQTCMIGSLNEKFAEKFGTSAVPTWHEVFINNRKYQLNHEGISKRQVALKTPPPSDDPFWVYPTLYFCEESERKFAKVNCYCIPEKENGFSALQVKTGDILYFAYGHPWETSKFEDRERRELCVRVDKVFLENSKISKIRLSFISGINATGFEYTSPIWDKSLNFGYFYYPATYSSAGQNVVFRDALAVGYGTSSTDKLNHPELIKIIRRDTSNQAHLSMQMQSSVFEISTPCLSNPFDSEILYSEACRDLHKVNYEIADESKFHEKEFLGDSARVEVLKGVSPGRSSLLPVGNYLGWYLLSLDNQAFLVAAASSGNAAFDEDNFIEDQFSSRWKKRRLEDSDIRATKFRFERLTTNVVPFLKRNLFSGGIGNLLTLDSQKGEELTLGNLHDTARPKLVAAPVPPTTLDFNGAYGSYFEEIFFHGPFLIAEQLRSNRRFEEAKQWYEYIFNPNALKSKEDSTNPADRFWRYLPFRSMTNESLESILSNQAEIDASNDDPFNPDAIARLRLSAYAKAVVMKYLENLLGWADSFFAQDTRESISQATNLYLLVNELLGKRPEIGEISGKPEPKNYDELNTARVASSALGTSKLLAKAPQRGVRFAHDICVDLNPYFCVPENQEFVQFWDRVENRLFKIRHGMNINGQRRVLDLFAPPIDPRALIAAYANGGSLMEVLQYATIEVPAYRFDYLVAQARSMVADLIQVGSLLLAALERKDGEALGELQITQAGKLLDLTTKIKEQQLAELAEQKKALTNNKANAVRRKEFYGEWCKRRTSTLEDFQLAMMSAALLAQGIALPMRITSAISYTVPEVGSPFAMTYGGKELGDSAQAWAGVADSASALLNQEAQILGVAAGIYMRGEEWKLQTDLAELDETMFQAQLDSNSIQVSIAERDLEIHKNQIGQSQDLERFYQEKFTKGELYGWMADRLSSMYFQAYSIAIDVARMAQRAYQFEHDTDEEFINYGYWDSRNKGLLAGEGLLLAINQMEKASTQRGTRPLEIQKTVSLRLLDPQAFLTFVHTGECDFAFTELLFDQDYPGHFRRKIKSVSVSIPAVVGPFQNIKATLTQTANRILLRASKQGVQFLLGEEKKMPGPDILQLNLRSGEQIAISTGVRDTGLFSPDFNGSKYLPFEGTGAVSGWHLSMRKENNSFDYNSISDVIIELQYTAVDGGQDFADIVRSLDSVKTRSSLQVVSLAGQEAKKFQTLRKGEEISIQVPSSALCSWLKDLRVVGLYLLPCLKKFEEFLNNASITVKTDQGTQIKTLLSKGFYQAIFEKDTALDLESQIRLKVSSADALEDFKVIFVMKGNLKN